MAVEDYGLDDLGEDEEEVDYNFDLDDDFLNEDLDEAEENDAAPAAGAGPSSEQQEPHSAATERQQAASSSAPLAAQVAEAPAKAAPVKVPENAQSGATKGSKRVPIPIPKPAAGSKPQQAVQPGQNSLQQAGRLSGGGRSEASRSGTEAGRGGRGNQGRMGFREQMGQPGRDGSRSMGNLGRGGRGRFGGRGRLPDIPGFSNGQGTGFSQGVGSRGQQQMPMLPMPGMLMLPPMPGMAAMQMSNPLMAPVLPAGDIRQHRPAPPRDGHSAPERSNGTNRARSHVPIPAPPPRAAPSFRDGLLLPPGMDRQSQLHGRGQSQAYSDSHALSHQRAGKAGSRISDLALGMERPQPGGRRVHMADGAPVVSVPRSDGPRVGEKRVWDRLGPAPVGDFGAGRFDDDFEPAMKRRADASGSRQPARELGSSDNQQRPRALPALSREADQKRLSVPQTGLHAPPPKPVPTAAEIAKAEADKRLAEAKARHEQQQKENALIRKMAELQKKAELDHLREQIAKLEAAQRSREAAAAAREAAAAKALAAKTAAEAAVIKQPIAEPPPETVKAPSKPVKSSAVPLPRVSSSEEKCVSPSKPAVKPAARLRSNVVKIPSRSVSPKEDPVPRRKDLPVKRARAEPSRAAERVEEDDDEEEDWDVPEKWEQSASKGDLREFLSKQRAAKKQATVNPERTKKKRPAFQQPYRPSAQSQGSRRS